MDVRSKPDRTFQLDCFPCEELIPKVTPRTITPQFEAHKIQRDSSSSNDDELEEVFCGFKFEYQAGQ